MTSGTGDSRDSSPPIIPKKPQDMRSGDFIRSRPIGRWNACAPSRYEHQCAVAAAVGTMAIHGPDLPIVLRSNGTRDELCGTWASAMDMALHRLRMPEIHHLVKRRV